MAWARAALVLVVAVGVGFVLLSGGSSSDPRTPAGLPGLPPPFLGTALVGGGEMTAAIDAYGDVVDLRSRPAGRATVEVPAKRQAASTVPVSAGVVPRARFGDGTMLPLWRADSVRQRYLPGANVLVTTARFGPTRATIAWAAGDDSLACLTSVGGASQARMGDEGDQTGAAGVERPTAIVVASKDPTTQAALRCDDAAAREIVRGAKRGDRRWLSRARRLGAGAPGWAREMYERSLLVLRALTSRGGGVAAGARDGWAYVWPRDAATAALAFAAAGFRPQARRIARFLLGLHLASAARFQGDGAPVPGRDAQGDAGGWTHAAAKAAALPVPPHRTEQLRRHEWRGRADYQEKVPGEYLGNAIASTAGEHRRDDEPQAASTRRQDGAELRSAFERGGVLVRSVGDPASGVDSAAAWAVQPFSLAPLYPAARRSLRQLLGDGGRFGIVPSADWPEADPWTAPTAWSAWSFAALARAAGPHASALARQDRRDALRLLAALRLAATPAGDLPERVDARTGAPRSTTPLAWSHAFAVLALLELWPSPG